ncbi:IS1380 family transposase, partial [Nocardia sp. NPDC059154]
MFSRNNQDQDRQTLSVRLFHTFADGSAMFDDDNLVSAAGLVPVMTLAEQTGLDSMFDEKITIDSPRIKSATANLAPKLATLVAGMCAGADSIDDIDLLRSGGMTELFGGVYAPSTVGILLREFTFGHTKQLESVMREHLLALIARADLLPRRPDEDVRG